MLEHEQGVESENTPRQDCSETSADSTCDADTMEQEAAEMTEQEAAEAMAQEGPEDGKRQGHKQELDSLRCMYGPGGADILKERGVLCDFLSSCRGDQKWFLALHNLAYLETRIEKTGAPRDIQDFFGQGFKQVLRHFATFNNLAQKLKQTVQQADRSENWRDTLEAYINSAYQGDTKSPAWDAFRMLVFPEIPYVWLGYARKTNGYGVRPATSACILANIINIIKKASKESGDILFVFFNLFQVDLSRQPSTRLPRKAKEATSSLDAQEVNVRMDKLSDLLTCLILQSLLHYTHSVTTELQEANPQFPYELFSLGKLINVRPSLCLSTLHCKHLLTPTCHQKIVADGAASRGSDSNNFDFYHLC